ncbi:MAG TPA: hypothetical protein PLU17_10435 [Chitinophagaceae bacterium]|nr:hypothetical protein [Chitinophagaceae bacterium]
MKTNILIRKAIILSIFAAVVVVNWSCKENTILPKNLVPSIDNINTFGTSYDLITHNVYQDSFLTGGLKSGLRLSSSATFYMACGSIQNDPAFGSTQASMHIEVLPPVPNFTFKTATANMKIDSIVLSIPFKMTYGDAGFSAINQKFMVYRSQKVFSRDSAQFEFTKDSFDNSRVLSTQTINFNTIATDSVLIAGQKQQPQLRFKLASWFADSLKAQVDSAANGATSSYSKFLDWWKGFVIAPSSTKGNTLGYFDTYKTRLTVYYRYTKSGGGEDTTNDVFSFDPNYCNRFNTITHDYSNSESKKFINTHAAVGDSLLFIQNEPGLANTFHIPGITNIDNVIVNKAELVFTTAKSQNFNDTLIYGLVPRLQIFSTDTSSQNDKVSEDYAAFASANYVDGKRAQKVIDGQTYVEYKFTVTYSIQKIISQKDSMFRYKIMGANIGFPAAYRTILAGSGSKLDAFKPKLNIIYTKINKL